MEQSRHGRRHLRLLAVVGASGGLGTSALAVAVAVRARRAGIDVVLVDGCPFGGGLDVTMGAEQEPGLRWRDLEHLQGEADGRALIARLPVGGGVPLLSFDRTHAGPDGAVVSTVLSALSSVRDLVVVDLPPAGAITDAVLARADRVLIVAGQGLRQLAALSLVAGRLTPLEGELMVYLRGPGGAVGGEVARVVEAELDLPVLCCLEEERGLVADLVNGVPPGSRARGAMCKAADEILGWAVLPQRGVA